MLVDQETEDKQKEIIEALAAALALYLVGRDLRPRSSKTQGMGNMSALDSMTPYEQAFILGKLVRTAGNKVSKKLSLSELQQWTYDNNVSLSSTEQATLDLLKDDSVTYLRNWAEEWKKDLINLILRANRQWRAEIAGTSDQKKINAMRKKALKEIQEGIDRILSKIEGNVQRLIQSELAQYYQNAQVVGLEGDELVYKIPRENACEHCKELHLNSDGSPKVYKLKDVMGNSNYGSAPYAWGFTIGPVHPYCACTLHIVSVDGEPT